MLSGKKGFLIYNNLDAISDFSELVWYNMWTLQGVKESFYERTSNWIQWMVTCKKYAFKIKNTINIVIWENCVFRRKIWRKWSIKDKTTGKLTWILTLNNISFMNFNNIPLGTSSNIKTSFYVLWKVVHWSRQLSKMKQKDGSINICLYFVKKYNKNNSRKTAYASLRWGNT